MKKKVSLLFVLSLLATAFFALAFANNIASVIHWWQGFLASGGDSSRFAAKAPGFIASLDWSAVDNSAVTTFIPLVGFICITRGLWRILRGRRSRAGCFPFFRGSDQLFVALGLFGTLWGIILIGYFKLDSVTMADLMMCLHTALFSTLAAVVWVFLADRPLLRPYLAGLLEKAGLAEADKDDLTEAVDRFTSRLDDYEKVLLGRIEELKKELSEERQRSEELTGRLAAARKALG